MTRERVPGGVADPTTPLAPAASIRCRRSTRLVGLLVAIASAAAIVACQAVPSTPGPGSTGDVPVSPRPSGGAPSGSGPAAASDSPAVAAARAAIVAADLGDPASLEAVDAIRFTDEAATAAAQALQAGVTGDALWAATWIYATSGTDPSVLAPVMSNTDPTVRVMAAVAALALGRPEAARVLVDLLSAKGNLRGAAPPISTSGFAAASLGRYIEGPTIGAKATPEEVAAAWTTWLASNEASMQFDPQTGRWRVP